MCTQMKYKSAWGSDKHGSRTGSKHVAFVKSTGVRTETGAASILGAAFPKRKPAAEDWDPHRTPRWVRLWEGDSPFQVTRLWITGCRAKMQPFSEKAPGGLGWDLVVRTRRKRAWCFHANRQLSSEQRVGGGPFRGRGTEPVSQKVRSTTNGRTTCLEASAAASQTQALATVGLCLQHRAWPGPRGRGQAPRGCDQAS